MGADRKHPDRLPSQREYVMRRLREAEADPLRHRRLLQIAALLVLITIALIGYASLLIHSERNARENYERLLESFWAGEADVRTVCDASTAWCQAAENGLLVDPLQKQAEHLARLDAVAAQLRETIESPPAGPRSKDDWQEQREHLRRKIHAATVHLKTMAEERK